VALFRIVLKERLTQPRLIIITKPFYCEMDKLMDYPIWKRPLHLASQWHRIADIIINIITDRADLDSHADLNDAKAMKSIGFGEMSYIGLHLRVESDICEHPDARSFFCSWTPQQWMKCLSGFLVDTLMCRRLLHTLLTSLFCRYRNRMIVVTLPQVTSPLIFRYQKVNGISHS
jgi:hypothetical protein